MITYEFCAHRLGSKVPFLSVAQDQKSRVTDFVEVPIELRIPVGQLRTEGADTLQARIEKAVQEMVDKLNA